MFKKDVTLFRGFGLTVYSTGVISSAGISEVNRRGMRRLRGWSLKPALTHGCMRNSQLSGVNTHIAHTAAVLDSCCGLNPFTARELLTKYIFILLYYYPGTSTLLMYWEYYCNCTTGGHFAICLCYPQIKYIYIISVIIIIMTRRINSSLPLWGHIIVLHL